MTKMENKREDKETSHENQFNKTFTKSKAFSHENQFKNQNKED